MSEQNKIEGNGNKAMQVMLAQYQPVAAVENYDRKGWLSYGSDNLYPQYLKSLAKTSPVHGALVKGIADMIAGKSISATSVIDQGKMKALRVDRVWRSICNDIEMYGGFYIERIKTLDRQGIARIEHLPFENCRLWVDDEFNICGVYYSRDWSQANKKINKPRPIPIAKKDSENASDVVVSFADETTSSLYPEPSYQSAINYIELDRKISQFHVSNVMNGFFPSTIISLFNGEPDPVDKQQMQSYFNKQTGAENAGQIMLLFNEAGSTPPTIESFGLTDADKMYESLARQATEKIMVGHLVTTPLIFGIRGEGTGFSSNTDELKQGFKIFTENVIEVYRKKALDVLSEATEIYTFQVTPNSYFIDDAPQGEQPTAGAAADVASQALNGAQIESLVNIITQAAASTIPIETAKALVAAGFPMLTTEQIDKIFAEIVPGTIPKEAVLRSVILNETKKKSVMCAKADMTDDDEDAWLNHLYERGETIDEDEWELDDELSGEAGDVETEEQIQKEIAAKNQGAVEMYKAYANPDAKSEMDGGIYKVRYGYPTKFSDNSRRFCKAMAEAASAGVVYRYEDIIRMGNEGVNGGFAPAGESTYSIFLYKGGANCHHFWSRKVYRRKRDAKGKILKNEGLKNDERISQSQANKAGFDFKDSQYWRKASTRPIDMPNNGYKNPQE